MLVIRTLVDAIPILKFGKLIKVYINTYSFWLSTFCYRIFHQLTTKIHKDSHAVYLTASSLHLTATSTREDSRIHSSATSTCHVWAAVCYAVLFMWITGNKITREPCALKLLFQMKAQEQPNTLDDGREPCVFYWKHKEPRLEKEENAFLAEILISHWNNATNDPWWKVWEE